MSSNTPVSLVKFLSAERSILMLKDQLIRWNAPHAYTDPFEYSYLSDLGFDKTSFTNALIKQISSMLFLRDDPSGIMTPIKKAVKRWRMEQRFRTEEEAQEALVHLLPTMVGKHFDEIEEKYNRWRLYAYNVRLMCLSDNVEDGSLWETLANRHRGVAIRFKVGADHAFAKPLKVHYRTNRIELFSLHDEVGRFMGNSQSSANIDLESRFLSKSKHKTSQREWRCITRAQRPLTPDQQANRLTYEMKRFNTNDVMAIYFGLKTSKEKIREIITVVEQSYPKAKLYLAKLNDRSYEIDFILQDLESLKLHAL